MVNQQCVIDQLSSWYVESVTVLKRAWIILSNTISDNLGIKLTKSSKKLDIVAPNKLDFWSNF